MELICLDAQKRKENALRASFNALAARIFGFDFEFWYQSGCWGGDYLPYCLYDRGTAVANVSVNRMNLMWNGEEACALQLGTVMTAPAYRHRGLLRRVMEAVLGEWKGKADFIYLFANSSVLNFYPKFGFQRLTEHRCVVTPSASQTDATIRKLDLSASADRAVLLRLARNHVPSSPVLSMRGNANLLLFYGLQFLKDDLYYWPGRDLLAVLEDDGENRTIDDVFSSGPFDLTETVSVLAGGHRAVSLGFTPSPACGLAMRYEPLGNDDSLFMMPVRGDFTRAMFPVLSHA